MNAEPILREDTMIYRVPTDDSPESAISHIWGRDLETRVVDASEVDELIGDGWVRDPRHIDNPPKPIVDRGKAEADLKAANERIAALESDLKAATELADAESKAKDEALAKLADADKAKTTLGIKAK